MPDEPQDKRRRMPDPVTAGLEFMVQRQQERRERIVEEIRANRRGEYSVPTWVLTLILVAMIGAIVIVLAVI